MYSEVTFEQLQHYVSSLSEQQNLKSLSGAGDLNCVAVESRFNVKLFLDQ